ncbi:MAG: hypothetical protein IJU23_13380 [Proteobacteria bacterium]|nr:hypothetical protein [Pseudomonadota bacterium]
MKTRNGLLFALCVLAGCAGFTACSESGSNEEEAKITVDPSSLTLEAGDTGSFNVTYLANANISVESSNTTCVTVASPVNTGADNKGKVDISAVGSNCNADITVSADNGKVKGTVKVTVNDLPAGPFISLSDSKLKLSVGETDKVTATFANGDTPIKGEQLVLENSDSSCVEVADKTSATGANGKVDISVTAKDHACDATITVKKPDGFDGDVKAKSFSVSVKGGGEEPSTQTAVLEFDDEAVSMSGDSDETVKAGAKLYYKENKVGIANKTVNIVGKNNKCVKSKESSYTTGTDGKFNVELVRTGTKCDTIITASVDDTTATLAVSVTDANEIVVKRIDVNANAKYDKMGWSMLVLLDGDGVTCDVAMAELAEYAVWDDAFVNAKNSAGEAPLVASFKAKDLVDAASAIKIDVTQHKGILAFASASDESEDVILGAGCTPISKENNNTVVEIELEPIPTDIKGEYVVYSNFDLTSAFEYSGTLATVENMKGGDWVNWIASLFDNPLNALWDFVWVNTLQRLAELDLGNEKINDIVRNFVGKMGKELAGGYVKPLIDGYLKDYKWYQVIKEVSPDVEDLLRNMQFKGKIVVSEATGLQINDASETFSSLQYMWSSSDIATSGCVDAEYTYGNAKCRKNMALSAQKGNAIMGSWNGAINDESLPAGVDGQLNINSHSLTFKWASILYSAVFGEILPTALDYKSKPNVQNGRYLSAFLDKILFDSIVNYYETKCVGQSKCGDKAEQEGDKKYPALQQTDITKSCERFVEALVYLISSDASSVSGVISVAAGFACGDQALGKLDEWVDSSLSKLESNTANQLTLKADNCSLYDGGTTQYMNMGQPDEVPYTAYDVFKPDSKTLSARCEWDITLPASVSSKPIKGLFHAYREED